MSLQQYYCVSTLKAKNSTSFFKEGYSKSAILSFSKLTSVSYILVIFNARPSHDEGRSYLYRLKWNHPARGWALLHPARLVSSAGLHKDTPLGTNLGFLAKRFFLFAGEWSESKECHTRAGGCSTEESWTDCHHHSSVQAWRWGHTVSYHTWILHDIVPKWVFDGLYLKEWFLSQISLLGKGFFCYSSPADPSYRLQVPVKSGATCTSMLVCGNLIKHHFIRMWTQYETKIIKLDTGSIYKTGPQN